jgi:hypothetical protein
MMTFKQAAEAYAAAEGDAKKEAAFWLFEATLEEKWANVDWDIVKSATRDACEFNVVGLGERGTPEEVKDLLFRVHRTLDFLTDFVRTFGKGTDLGDWLDQMADELADIEIETDPIFQEQVREAIERGSEPA